jgi:hypothetical protein
MHTVRILILCAAAVPCLHGYAVLAHEAIIDTAWRDSIEPLLHKRFPNATADDLTKAHAYAYGGCIIQDMGYYPFGSQFFSDLVHYVRSGDFVQELIAESQDLNEYAFALGSLAHYSADTEGHAIAVNPSVALTYPKLRAKYGRIVTYEDDPAAHLKVEFGFDVMEVASGNYSPQAYHDFIGFEVSKRLLEAAFDKIYGLEMADIFTSLDLALGTYRHTVGTLLPEATKVAWELKKDEITKAQPGITQRRFIYNLSRSGYVREWGRGYRRPGILARILAFLFRIVPKVGPFRGVDFKPPSGETAKLFMESFNRTLSRYQVTLGEVRDGRLQLANRDFDTGLLTAPGEYALADDTYAKLARELAEKPPAAGSGIVNDVFAFFKDPKAPIATRRHRKEWQRTLRALAQLHQAAAPALGPTN